MVAQCDSIQAIKNPKKLYFERKVIAYMLSVLSRYVSSLWFYVFFKLIYDGCKIAV
jgi:hypothetical protein